MGERNNLVIMEKKSLWQTLLGTIQGMNNEGSSKRVTMFWMVVIITTGLTVAYIYGYIQAVNSPQPTKVHQKIVDDYNLIRWSDYLLILTISGYATLELLTAIVRKFTGVSIPDKPVTPQATTTTTTTATVTETPPAV